MKAAFPYRYILTLPTFKYGCLVWLNINEGKRQRQAALMSNHCLLSNCRYDMEKRKCLAVVV